MDPSINKRMTIEFSDKPQRIICLTEESVETLSLLNSLNLVVGVSIFVKRPVEAQNLPKVSAFTDSHFDKILALKPDLILGFSDIQKDIARELIGQGQNVWISNQRSIKEIFEYVLMLGSLVGKRAESYALIEKWQNQIQVIQREVSTWKRRPRVYFEEWDEPTITAIKWVSELIEVCGGENIFADKSNASLARDRICDFSEVLLKDPDIIFGCWCGKKVKLNSFALREGWGEMKAIKNSQVFELEPEIFLQPGPALFEDGLEILMGYFRSFQDS